MKIKNIFSKYQFSLISIGIITIIIGFLFNKPLTGEYIFGGPDSLSPSAVHQGISSAEEMYTKYPLWLPWIFSGLPSVHSFQNISDYYFPNYLMNILKSIGIPGFWNYIFHFILAGMGIFSILRTLGTNWYCALYGSLTFVLMPYLITMIVHGHGSQMMTSAWIPWIIWSILRLHNKINFTNIGILGLLIGFQLQRAHVQIAYYSWMAAGLLIIMLLCNFYGQQSNKSKWLIYSALGMILGLFMAMWIYLPALNYVPFSIRGAGIDSGAGYNYATAWSFSFGEIATFFIPSFYGFGGVTYWGNMPFTDYPNYMGIITLTLALIGMLFHKSKIKWYFITTGFIALLISFGRHFFLYQIFYDYFPYFNKFRVPVMILILTQFSIAVLAGLGLDVSINMIKNNKKIDMVKKLIPICGVVVFIIISLKLIMGIDPDFSSRSHPALNSIRINMINTDMMKSILFILFCGSTFYITFKGKIGKRGFAGIMIMLSSLDMIIVDHQIIEPDKKSYRQSTMTKRSLISNYLSEDEVIKYFRRDTSKYRILPLGVLGNENRWAAFQIESVRGYHPAKISLYNKMIDEVGWNYLGVLQMLNVKYIVTLEELPHPAFELVFSGKLFYKGAYQNANVYKFINALPRIFFAQDIKVIEELTDQFNLMRTKEFNPRQTAIISEHVSEFTYHPNAEAEIIYWSPDKIEIQVDVPSSQLLILSEIYYPNGWEITNHPDWIIFPVNSILRGIRVPKGKHHIIMEFLPDDVFKGSLLTWGSTGILIFFILIGLIDKRSKK